MNISVLNQKQRQLKQLVAQLGFINTCLYLANRLAEFFHISLSFNKYYFVAQFLNEQSLLPSGRGRQFRVIEVPSDLVDQHPCPRPAAVIANRYDQGAICLAAYKDEEFAGCLWYVKNRYMEDEVRGRYDMPSNDSVWDFDVFVEPKFRLSPVFLKLWDTASAKLLSEGCCWSMSRISAFNAMSLSSHKRMGAKVIGWAVFMRFRKLQLTLTPSQPYIHFSSSDFSYPIFKLQPPQS